MNAQDTRISRDSSPSTGPVRGFTSSTIPGRGGASPTPWLAEATEELLFSSSSTRTLEMPGCSLELSTSHSLPLFTLEVKSQFSKSASGMIHWKLFPRLCGWSRTPCSIVAMTSEFISGDPE